MRYRNVSSHLEDIADGRAFDPGDYFDLTDKQAKDPYNAAKIDSGVFVKAPLPQPEDSGETTKGEK